MPKIEDRTREILKKVRQVEIRSRKQVNDSLVGAYHSVFRGQGMDFEEVREYAPGDDVRSIDWNVTAKMDRPFIKKFREERELTIMLLVDLSASGDFGSVADSKRELAAEVASVLAFSATRNNDKVGLLLFTDEVEKFIPPSKGRAHILRVIREILYFEPKRRGTDIVDALRYMNKVVRKHAVTFVLSDFLVESVWDAAPGDASSARQNELVRQLSLANRRHDVICMELTDPREEELPNVGVITLEDAETGEQRQVDTGNRRLREEYRSINRLRGENLRKLLRQSGIDHVSIHTDRPWVKNLREYLKRRSGRR